MVILSTGARLPVHFESQVISSSVANLGSLIDAAKIKSRVDHVYALVRVVSTEDDQVSKPLVSPFFFLLCGGPTIFSFLSLFSIRCHPIICSYSWRSLCT